MNYGGGGAVASAIANLRAPPINHWRQAESFTIPNARCPVCFASVFFYRSPEGGRVFFDELGPPWPKHPCTDQSSLSFLSGGKRPRSPKVKAEPGWTPLYWASVKRHASVAGVVEIVFSNGPWADRMCLAVARFDWIDLQTPCLGKLMPGDVLQISTLRKGSQGELELRLKAVISAELLPKPYADLVRASSEIQSPAEQSQRLMPPSQWDRSRKKGRTPIKLQPTGVVSVIKSDKPRRAPKVQISGRKRPEVKAPPPMKRPVLSVPTKATLEPASKPSEHHQPTRVTLPAEEPLSAHSLSQLRASGASAAEVHHQRLLHKIKLAKARKK
ncbi:hypothetical protein [Roseateles chitinivorans]|uniref:hypothetical protein n=1 Tax=Roseateles chitinivorans TaxID=2917965 RepID=UPI001304352B|nr:hypothetical protein [Roseateles chitinivorans]